MSTGVAVVVFLLALAVGGVGFYLGVRAESEDKDGRRKP